MPPAPPTPTNVLAAVLWMVAWVVTFSVMTVAGRMLLDRHDTFEVMMWRSLVGLVAVVAAAALLGRLSEVRTDRLPRHGFRNLVHFTGQNLWLYAMTLIPLAQVIALEFTAPLWVMLLAVPMLGERLTALRVAAAGLGFAGVVVVADPDFGHVQPGVIAGAVAAVMFALTNVLTKTLTRSESALSVMVWLTLMQTGLGIAGTFADGRTTWPLLADAPLILLVGVTGMCAHLFLTKALSLAPASTVIPIDFARLPILALAGWLVFAEPLAPQVAVGAALILAGILLSLRASRPRPADDASVTPR